ncbi:MAG: leucyl aminopeptidase [Propionibacteriaceae bacterium]|jgi:leucyl aminopeptidase|nr:leucyl aminopeptidase [Propionibacteriaceae bacterium]
MIELDLAGRLSSQADTTVVGLRPGGDAPTLSGWPKDQDKSFAKRHGQSLLQAARLIGASADQGVVRVIPDGDRRRVVVGLGQSQPDPESLRQAVASAVRGVTGGGDRPLRHIALSLGLDDPASIRAAGEGALLAAYRFTPVSAAAQPAGLERVTVVAAPNASARRAVELARATATAVNRARDLVNRPPNLLAPADLAERATALARPAKVKVEVLDQPALVRGGYGGLLAVGGGSDRPPRLVKLSWAPRGAQAHVALVGKGITFDSGGLDLKPPAAMATMASDMAGAAVCLAAIVAAAELDLKVTVTAWLALAENLPSGTAYRPSDVITIHDGTTVENYNTDAEGRLVLADALSRAGQDKPDLLVDIATLTGAKMIALGNSTNAVFASDDATADQLLAAARDAGEAFWRLPITAEARQALKSQVADIKSGGRREGGALVAAAFLQRFTAGLPWAHLDIAGAAFNTGEAHDLLPAGGTGTGVRTLIALLTALAA